MIIMMILNIEQQYDIWRYLIFEEKNSHPIF